jgi:zinc protease
MRPDLTTIVVVGNISPQTARAAIEREFGAWHASGAPPKLELPAVPLNPSADVHLTVPALGQDSVTLSQIVPLARTAPQYAALQLGNAILGGGTLGPEQSRLFRDIRQEAGLVYSITSQLSTGGDRTRFVVDYACLPSNESRITSLVDSEIDRLQTQPVGTFELNLMKASIVRHTLIDEGALGSIGGTLLDDATDHLPLDQPRIDARAVMAADESAVRTAFGAYIHPSNFVRVLVGP